MGGIPPLGYTPKDRGLIINHKEAELVRAIYNNFVETNSVTETVRKINKEGHKTKSWISEKERFMKEKHLARKPFDIFYKTQFMLGRFFTREMCMMVSTKL